MAEKLQAIGVQVRQTGTQFRSYDFSRNDQALRREMFMRHNLGHLQSVMVVFGFNKMALILIC
jgi:hypothetical protein